MATCGTFQNLRPLSLLTHLSSCYDSAHLQVSSNSVSWSFYLEQGKITYASHSVEPFDRLDRHLRRLSYQIPTLVSEIRANLRFMFETAQESQLIQAPDHQAISWLVTHQYLNSEQATALIEGLVKEVIESFLLIKGGTYQLNDKLDVLPDFCQLELQPIIEHCQKQLQGWQSLGTRISSPYQRPYFLGQTIQQKLLPKIGQRLTDMIKGFSFYHLAVLLNQDELQLAQSLYPYIMEGTILLQEPLPAFAQLPKICEQSPEITNYVSETVPPFLATDSQVVGNKSKYIIVSVDDSPIILRQISQFLDDENFTVIPIGGSLQALVQIVRLEPNLILLNVNMADVDGYELCRLIKNHSLFINIPTILIIENPGLIDRVKARFVGASGYLPQPFTRSDLLKVVFRYLT